MIDKDYSLSAYNDMNNAALVKRMNEVTAVGVQRELPRYRCHKEVWALKLGGVRDTTESGSETDGSRVLVPADEGYAPFRVDREYIDKHKPEAGGYYIVYKDGYKSFSPAGAFEDGYTRL